MTAADWLAVWAGAPAFIAAVTALVVALRANGTANANAKSLAAHVTSGDHDAGDM